MCDFCERFDFSSASYEVDKYGTRIILSGGSYRFPEAEQFSFCPKCGKSRVQVMIERDRQRNNKDG